MRSQFSTETYSETGYREIIALNLLRISGCRRILRTIGTWDNFISMVQVGWGSVISGTIGAAAAILVMIGRYKLDKRIRRKKLRRALFAELNSINRLNAARDMLGSSSGRFFYTHHDFIPTSVYEENLSELGLLTEEEIEDVVRFYSNAIIVKEEISACAEVLDGEDRGAREIMSAMDSTRSSIEILIEMHNDALQTLGQHVDDAFSERISISDQSSEEEDISVNITPVNKAEGFIEGEQAIIEFDASSDQLEGVEVEFGGERYELDDSTQIEVELPDPGSHMVTIIGEDSKESASIDVQAKK